MDASDERVWLFRILYTYQTTNANLFDDYHLESDNTQLNLVCLGRFVPFSVIF